MKKLLLLSAILFLGSFLKAQSNFVRQDSVFARATDCTGGVSVCIDSVNYLNTLDMTFRLDGQPFTGATQECRALPFVQYQYAISFGSGETGIDGFKLNSWSVNGVTFSINKFPNFSVLADSMKKWDPLSNWAFDATGNLIIGYPPPSNVYSDQSITGLNTNTSNTIQIQSGTFYQGLKFKVPAGIHKFELTQNATSQKDTVTLLAACIQRDTVQTAIGLGTGSNAKFCMNTSQLLGTPQSASFKNICANPTTHVNFNTPNNFCIAYSPQTVGTDTACLVVCDQYGFCDTTILAVTAFKQRSTNQTFTDFVDVGQTKVRCAKKPFGTLNLFQNYCLSSSGTNAQMTLDPFGGCLNIKGLTAGVDTACLAVCNVDNICDTSIFIISVGAGVNVTVLDTIVLDSSIVSRCNISIPTGTINFFKNICAAGLNVEFKLDTIAGCINYKGLKLGTDSACVRVCNTTGTCDTTIFKVTTKNYIIGTKKIVLDSVDLGVTKARCDITKPTGTIVSFKNICSANSGSKVQFTLDTVAGCINFKGIAVGIDSACVQVCNKDKTCDTTIFIIKTTLKIQPSSKTVYFDSIFINGTTKSDNRIKRPSGTIASYKFYGAVGNKIQFALDSSINTFAYKGILPGTDTVSFSVCNTEGACDTSIFYVTALPVVVPISSKTVYFDTIPLNGTTKVDTRIKRPSGTISTYAFYGITGTNIQFTLDSSTNSFTYKGLAVGTDTISFSVCNTNGDCDTSIFYVTAKLVPVQGRSFAFNDSIIVGGQDQNRCGLIVKPLGTIKSVKNICALKSGTHALITLDSATNCINFKGLAVGNDTACIEVCNTLNTCDTTNFYVKVKPFVQGRKTTLIDSVTLSPYPLVRCDINIPSGNIYSFNNYCPQNSGQQVTFTLDAATRCVSIRGIAVGVDSACIRVCNTEGVCDTTLYIIQAKTSITKKKGATYVISDTITVGLNSQKCGLSYPTAQVLKSFKNNCPQFSGTNIAFVVDSVNKCIKYTGLTPGVDTACVLACDINDICDTTLVYIRALAAVPVVQLFRKYVYWDTLGAGVTTKSYSGFTKPTGATTMVNYCPNAGNNISFVLDVPNFKVTYGILSANPKPDSACIKICNASNVCDTTIIYIAIKQAPLTERVDTIRLKVNQRVSYCPDISRIAGSPITNLKFSKPSSFDNVKIALDNASANKCAKIDGLTVGTDTVYLVVSNTAGATDSTKLFIIVEAGTYVPAAKFDSVFLRIGQLTPSVCIDTTDLFSGNITSIKSCTPVAFNIAMMTIDSVTKCVKFRGLALGRDTACVELCNDKGLCQKTFIITTVSNNLPPVASTEIVTVKLGKDSLFTNIDSSQILGKIDTLFDACPGKNGLFALMVLDRDTRTVKITGRAIGSDTLCLVIYNRANNLYDTTFIVANVIDSATNFNIKAIDDFDSVRFGSTLIFKLYDNDTLLKRTPTSLNIITQPTKGTVEIISVNQGTVKYEPFKVPAACGVDSFRYEVCVNGTFCSQAVVIVEVKCNAELKAYNAISPNGDRDNEFFVIDGLQNYPNNTLLVFNRWGNEVLKAKNYENDWSGTWKDKILPDGTYYYLLRNDDNNEIILSGYVQIQR